MTLTGCSKDEFTCNDGNCLTMDKRCDGNQDCSDESDEKGCKLIKAFEGYNKFRVPVPLGGQTKFILNFSVSIDKIINIDENNGNFKIKMTIIRTWYNPHLKFLNVKRLSDKNLISTEDRQIMWIPSTVFENLEQANELQKTSIKKRFKVIPNPSFKFTRSDKMSFENNRIFEGSENALIYTTQYSVNWICDYNMAWYPFDSQVCSPQFFHQEVSISTNPVSVEYLGTNQLPQHSVKFVTICSYNVSNKPGVIVEVHLSRPLFGSILTIFLPTGVLVILSQIVGVFHRDNLDMVIGVNLTLLLVLATL